ncbi:hypothetical protein EV356DRAFT_26463 [Viridothelium virens]|uniref:Uncharacterized protein n=1 Tax=Viridothelium virens TaxID=1048519 RepID=A0A6A6HHX4_VIRVR|nr:hypothetical protein EV356DRAFT_26463 [Viridothelium virens]
MTTTASLASSNTLPPPGQPLPPLASTTTADLPTRPTPNNTHHRLSLPPATRLLLITSLSSTLGLFLGLTHGATLAGLQFRAENAHRLPDTRVGWYLYHKSKNYVAMWGGVKEGVRMAGRVGLWTGLFVVAEEGVDCGRGRMADALGWRRRSRTRTKGEGEGEGGGMRDFLSSVVAGLSTAGAFSLWNRFPMPTAARTARLGLKFGVVYGLMQDAVGIMRGRRVGYVDWIMRWRRGEMEYDGDSG